MDRRLLDILVCPATKGKLVLMGSDNSASEQSNNVLELWSRSAGLAYPVTDGIPHMVESEARTLSNDEMALLKDNKS